METKTDRGIKELRETIKNHLDNSKLMDKIKDRISVEDLTATDKVDKLRQEGLLGEIMTELQSKLSGRGKSIVGGYEVSKASSRYAEHKEFLDPNTRYMIVKALRGTAFVDYLDPRSDEYLSLSLSYLDQRYSSSPVTCKSEPNFDLTVHFEIPEAYDSHTMLKSYSPLVVVLQKHNSLDSTGDSQGGRPVVLSTALVDWRELLCHNSVDINIGKFHNQFYSRNETSQPGPKRFSRSSPFRD